MEDATAEIITVSVEKPPGILGDGALRPGKGNLALVRRAIRNRWPVPKELRESLIAQCQAVMEQSYKPADIIAAAKTILEADKINVAVTNMDAPTSATQVNVGLAVNNNSGPTARDVAIELLKTAEGRAMLAEQVDSEP